MTLEKSEEGEGYLGGQGSDSQEEGLEERLAHLITVANYLKDSSATLKPALIFVDAESAEDKKIQKSDFSKVIERCKNFEAELTETSSAAVTARLISRLFDCYLINLGEQDRLGDVLSKDLPGFFVFDRENKMLGFLKNGEKDKGVTLKIFNEFLKKNLETMKVTPEALEGYLVQSNALTSGLASMKKEMDKNIKLALTRIIDAGNAPLEGAGTPENKIVDTLSSLNDGIRALNIKFEDLAAEFWIKFPHGETP